MLKRLFFPDNVESRGSIGLFVLRAVAGVAFMMHGWKKIQHPFDWMGAKSTMPGFLQALAALSEFGGGLAWIVGLLVPLASFGILCTMAVALYTHISKHDAFIGKWEIAAIYFGIALVLLLAGPGKISADALIFGRKRAQV